MITLSMIALVVNVVVGLVTAGVCPVGPLVLNAAAAGILVLIEIVLHELAHAAGMLVASKHRVTVVLGRRNFARSAAAELSTKRLWVSAVLGPATSVTYAVVLGSQLTKYVSVDQLASEPWLASLFIVVVGVVQPLFGPADDIATARHHTQRNNAQREAEDGQRRREAARVRGVVEQRLDKRRRYEER